MTKLYFTSNKTDYGWLHWAKVDDLYFLIYQSRYGLCGRVSDVSKPSPIIHQIDCREYRVHPDEVKRMLQGWFDDYALNLSGETSTLGESTSSENIQDIRET